MYLDWAAIAFVAVVLLVALWPALQAFRRNRYLLGATYAVAGLLIAIGLPMVVTNAWEAVHPDAEWSIAAPAWLTLGVSPVATLPLVLFGTWALNAVMGWNTRRAPS